MSVCLCVHDTMNSCYVQYCNVAHFSKYPLKLPASENINNYAHREIKYTGGF